MDSNNNPHRYAPSFCRLSQAYLTNPIGLSSHYPQVVKVRMVGLLNLRPAIPFVLVRNLSATRRDSRSCQFVNVRLHSRFATNWLTDTFVYEIRSEFGAASSLRSEAR